MTGSAQKVHLKLLYKHLSISIIDIWQGLKGAYIKYVGGGPEGSYKLFKKIFVARETIDLNISWPSNFLGKYFMAPPISFSFLFKAYL